MSSVVRGYKVRRTYNLRNGMLIRHDTIIHVQQDKADAFLWGIGNNDVTSVRYCYNHNEHSDGGLNRDIVTFLYTKINLAEEDIQLEKRALSYVTPLGSRIYRPSHGSVRRVIFVSDPGKTDYGNQDGITADPAWCNGFPETRVLCLSNPMLTDFSILCGVVTATCCEDVWFIYPMSPYAIEFIMQRKTC